MLFIAKNQSEDMVKPRTIKAIYKCVLYDAKELVRTPDFRLRNQLQLEQWGIGRYIEPRRFPPPTADRIRSLAQYHVLQEQGFRSEDKSLDLLAIVRQGFRANMALTDPAMISDKVDEAIAVMQELADQLQLAKCSSVTTTKGLRIEATSQYVPSHSRPEQHIYRFTYRITITNEHEHDALQITGRQYTFESSNGQRIALPRNSPGIVGQVPILLPGQTYEYASGVDIDAPSGNIVGCLHVVRNPHEAQQEDQDPTMFDAFVSKFLLLAPIKN